jgi:ankyrin repeat protein
LGAHDFLIIIDAVEREWRRSVEPSYRESLGTISYIVNGIVSLVAMRVVGVDSYRDEDDDGGLAKVRQYNAYINSIRPSLPRTVNSLLDVSVHDSYLVSWLADDGQFEITFVTENIVEDISRVTLRFTDAEVLANDVDPVETLRLTDGSTMLLTSEFDVLSDALYRYQIMMTPTGELSISFSDVAIHRYPATRAEYDALGKRPDTGRWGREANAWLDDLPALHRAAALGDTSQISELLAGGNPIDEVDSDTGWTALHAAARRVQLPAMELLLRAGADINRMNSSGQTPLGLAARDSDWRAVEFLVSSGADVNRGDDGEFPLSAAASVGNTEAMHHLILGGADPNHVDSDGWSVLMYATEGDRFVPVEILIAVGADSTIRSHDGKSAADIARDRGQLRLAQILDEDAAL